MAPQALAPRPAARAFSAGPAGPAMTVLVAMMTRIAIIVRIAAVACVAVQVALSHAFYLHHLWTLWGPLVAMVWGCVAIVYLHHRRPPWPLICLDSAVYLALAVGAGWCVATGIRGEAGSWLFIVVASQLPVGIWFAPRWLSILLAFTAGAGFLAGAALSEPGHVLRGVQPGAVAVLFAAVVAVHWFGRWLLYRTATRADATLAAADLDAREQYVILSRNIERREHDRLLHDTVLNTLTAIARSGDPEEARRACRDSIGMLERALSEPAEPVAASQPSGDPFAAIAQVVGEMRARGLDVHLEAIDGVAAGAADVTAEPDDRFPAPAPAAVARALAHATREALVNVDEHAGTGEAWVTVSAARGVVGPGASLRVVIQDAGAGFDPDRVDLIRLGVRRSIKERVADVGGSAEVRSAPGSGTVVELAWPGTGPAEPVREAPVRPGYGGALAFQTAGGAASQERDPW